MVLAGHRFNDLIKCFTHLRTGKGRAITGNFLFVSLLQQKFYDEIWSGGFPGFQLRQGYV